MGGAQLFGPSFTLSALLAGDSVQDLLITTQWSSNPTDLIDSDCCLGLTALPNPPSMPFSASVLLPIPRFLPSIPHKALICMTAEGAPRRRDAGRIGGTGRWGIKCVYTATGNSWQGDGCLHTRPEAPQGVCEQPPPPPRSPSLAFCLTKTDESTPAHSLSPGRPAGEKFLSSQTRLRRG